ncbi:hypothetical protein [Pseudomonas sp. BF-B-26]|jgi:hypothetical protein|uniref:hypothetical protein n=1 Tax=Pseudomonas sp. BF-B-26 TaxID=2832400 RepID=UPI001CBD3DDF|nr:hypothetical protein [Pseudomonas sp. BF-B-26]
MKQLLTLASLITGMLSAFFWVMSAFAKVQAPEERRSAGNMTYRDGSIIFGGNDLAATLKRQSLWNSWAAGAAAATAMLQVAATAVPDGI